ncbi:uncharacterized protein ACRADG_003077 [Cochliomyia hominivorax]
MRQRLKLFNCILIFLFILELSSLVQSDCNVCNAQTNTACISDFEFQQCEDNKPFGTKYRCNEGYYCSILGNCTKSASLNACQDCLKCDDDNVFACLDTKRFALCIDGALSDITSRCTGDLMCNRNNRNICGLTAPSCSYRDDQSSTTEPPTTTTVSPAQDPNAFCRLIKKSGRYPVGTNPQTTCRQYVTCVQVGDVWYGPIYNCPGNSYFDMSRNGCVATKPAICKGTVTGLSFRNLLLELE